MTLRTFAGISDTEAQVYALIALAAMTAREVAQALWPDSPAWAKRTRKRLGRNGAMGGTMPMRAGRILNAMASKGLVERVDDNPAHANLWRARWR
jgi:hypothetical protein